MSFLTFTTAILFSLIAGLLVFSTSAHRGANRLLGLLFFLYSLQMALMTVRIEGGQAEAYLLTSLVGMIIGPVVWLYCRTALTTDAEVPKRMFLHAIPALVMFSLVLSDVPLHHYKDFSILISMAIYALLCFRLLGYKTVVPETRKGVARYMNYFCLVLFYFLCFTIVIDLAISFELALMNELVQSRVLIFSLLLFSIVGLGLTVAIMGRADFITWIFNRKYASTSGKASITDNEKKHIIRAFESFITSDEFSLESSWTVSNAAKNVGVSGRKLSEAMNLHYGKSFPQYINELRINEVKTRLKESGDPILNIMLDAGFKSKSNFNKAFHNAVGMSPNDYRSQSIKNKT